MTATITSGTIRASAAATAWLNAFLATGNIPEIPKLYRTLSVEFFEHGVQFVGTDGTILFRTWVPNSEDEHPYPMPEVNDLPERAVVVTDPDKFALTFMSTLLRATSDQEYVDLQIAVEPYEGEDQALGSEFKSERLTLRAVGQELHCRLYEDDYPKWRSADFGLDKLEIVDSLSVTPKAFSLVGKLKGVSKVDCSFTSSQTGILIHGVGEAEVRGIVMPMRKEVPKPAKVKHDEQIDIEESEEAAE